VVDAKAHRGLHEQVLPAVLVEVTGVGIPPCGRAVAHLMLEAELGRVAVGAPALIDEQPVG
jgi:hypothetical protein